jgi:hypothetical protein
MTRLRSKGEWKVGCNWWYGDKGNERLLGSSELNVTRCMLLCNADTNVLKFKNSFWYIMVWYGIILIHDIVY